MSKTFERIRYEYTDPEGFQRVWVEGNPGQESDVRAIAETKLVEFCERTGEDPADFIGDWVRESDITSGQYAIDLDWLNWKSVQASEGRQE